MNYNKIYKLGYLISNAKKYINNLIKQRKNLKKGKNMIICFKCHQPITNGSSFEADENRQIYHRSTEVQGYYGAGGLGCPTPDQIIDNLKVAMEQGFMPEFCRTHENKHKN